MQVEKRDGSHERRILTGLIVDDGVLGRISSRWTKEGLFNSRWANLIGQWCVDYHERYGKAPGKSIEALFETWAAKARDAETVELVEKLLQGLSGEYVSLARESNTDLIVDLAAEHFEKVRLAKLRDAIESDLANGDVAKASQRVDKSFRVEIGAAAGVDVLSDRTAIKRAFERKKEPLIKYPGALGNFFEDALERDGLIAFEAPEKRGKCIAEDSEILLEDGGIVTIREYVEKEMTYKIIVQNQQTKKFIAQAPTQLWSNGEKECFEVTTRTGRRVTTTGNHEYQTPTGWRFLDDLRPGDFIAVPKRLAFFGMNRVPEAELKFVAYMIAEGCTTQNYWQGRKAGCNASFTNTDPILINDFLDSIRELGIDARPDGISFLLNRVAQTYTRKYQLRGCSAKTKRIPPQVFNCPKDQIALFLRILFSCDGSIYPSRSGKQIEITLANEKLIYQIGHLLSRFGIVFQMTYEQATCEGELFDAWRISIRSEEYVNLFLEEINFLSGKQTEPTPNSSMRSFLDRIPYEVMRELWETVKQDGKGSLLRVFGQQTEKIREQLRLRQPMMRLCLRGIEDSRVKALLDSEVLWDPIVSIRAVGKRKTYDLGVNKHHCFVANDCLVHNTFWLLDMAWRAMQQGRHVAFFEVGDMSEGQIMLRFACRAAKRPLKATTSDKPVWYPTSIEHVPDTRFAAVEREERHFEEAMTWKEANQYLKLTREKYGNKLKLSTHPNSSISVSGMRSVLDSWARAGWGSPDVIVVDYADLLSPPASAGDSERDQINATWKELRALGQETHSLVVTATQSNAESYDAETLSMRNFSGDKRKNAHVTGMVGINQTPDEKLVGLQRLNWVVLRESEFVSERVCHVAGCLSIANPAVHSIF